MEGWVFGEEVRNFKCVSVFFCFVIDLIVWFGLDRYDGILGRL